jgi:transposase
MWCVAELDADYIARMEDLLGLYERPYNAREPVVCLDEKPVALHADVRPVRPARPGHLAKRDSEYRRCGMANLFAIVEPKAGRHFSCATPDRSARAFARVVERVVTAYPRARTIHLVLDNLNIHCEKSLTEHFGRSRGHRLWRRLDVHFTPKHGSWLNQAELELSLLSRTCLGTRRISDLGDLQRETRAWTARATRRKLRIRWQFTRKDARCKFGYQRNLSSRSKT